MEGGRMLQLNIVGKRSGEGFVADRLELLEALNGLTVPRLSIAGVIIGAKGFIGLIGGLSTSNVVKVNPIKNVESPKALKLTCGSYSALIDDSAWVNEKMAQGAICDLRISPVKAVSPNIGAQELAEALSRVIPFAAKVSERPVLNGVNVRQADSTLTLKAADGFIAAIVKVPFTPGEAEVTISLEDIAPIAKALRKAKRVNLSIVEAEGEDPRLVIETERCCYKLSGLSGSYPNFDHLIPDSFTASAQVDTLALLKAVKSVSSMLETDVQIVYLRIGNGAVKVFTRLERGIAQIDADVTGEVETALNSVYLAQALRSGSGLADLSASPGSAPISLRVNGFQALIMPVKCPTPEGEGEAITEAQAEAEAITEAEAIAQAITEAQAEADARAEAIMVAEAEAIAKARSESRSRLEAQAEAKPEAKADRKRKRKPTLAQKIAQAEAKAQGEAEAIAEAEAITEAQGEAIAEAEAITEAKAETDLVTV